MIIKNLLCIWTMVVLCACQATHGTAESWAAVNTFQKVGMPHQNANPGPARLTAADSGVPATAPGQHTVLSSMALQQAVAQMVPSDYQLEIADDLSLDTPVKIDASKNWLEALGQALAEANIEFITNLYKKSATIRWNKVTLAQFISTHLPDDFTVYSDSGIDLQSLVRFDPRQYWAEALSSSTADSGVDLTINYSSKVIALRSGGNVSASRAISPNPQAPAIAGF